MPCCALALVSMADFHNSVMRNGTRTSVRMFLEKRVVVALCATVLTSFSSIHKVVLHATLFSTTIMDIRLYGSKMSFLENFSCPIFEYSASSSVLEKHTMLVKNNMVK